MRNLLILVVAITLLSSCSDARRMQRIVARHPDWIKPNNPVMVHDTIVLESIHVDTNFILTNSIDTFLIYKDKVKIKIIHDGNKLGVETEVKGDTIIKTITVPCPPTLVPPQPISWWQCALMWIGGILLVLFIIAVVIVLLTGLKPRLKL